MKEHKTRNVIPFGIFLIIFLFMLILSAAISSGYFYFEAKNRIAEIESYTRNYSIPLAEAFANLAELSYKDKNFAKLKRLFREKIQANIIDEAFFVLSDGSIIVHSDKEIENELKGNIATDEFAYNIDLIMLPIWTKTDHVQLMDYHIYNDDKKIPFTKEITKLLKKYIYKKVDVQGWLITRAVYFKGKGIGCISFIISKDRIYKFLLEHFNNTIKLSFILTIISFFISFLVSIIVFIRYRSLRMRKYPVRVMKKKKPESAITGIEKSLKEAIRIKSDLVDKKVKSKSKTIKDAILVNK